MTNTQNDIANQPGADPIVAALATASAPWPAVAAAAADAKLATATLILDVGDAISVTDHFVITNGSNTRQVKAITDEIEYQVKLVGGPAPVRVEGLESLDWVLIDYGEFVVHVFSEEARGYYQLERLWKDCDKLDWRSMVPEDLRHRVEGSDEAPAPVADVPAGGVPAEAPVPAADVPAGDESVGDAIVADDASVAADGVEVDPVVERATW